MRVLVVFTLAFVAFAAAERNWIRVFSNDRKVVPVNDHRIPHKPSTRISNGNEAVPHSRPWHVGLYISTWIGPVFCSGSLIDEFNILTAAQCINHIITDIKVVLGAHNIEEDEDTKVMVPFKGCLLHEEYDPNSLHNDISLIWLSSPVTFNENIQPLPVDSTSCSDDYAGRDASVSGWGHVSDSSFEFSPVLREVTMPVISNTECASYYGSFNIEPTVICTNTSGGKSPCNGDSGGALVLDGHQIGIISFLLNGCESGNPAGFTRVCKFSSWIEKNKYRPNGSSSRTSVCFVVNLLLLLFVFIIY